jgi:hypothetical protein
MSKYTRELSWCKYVAFLPFRVAEQNYEPLFNNKIVHRIATINHCLTDKLAKMDEHSRVWDKDKEM